MKTNFALAVVVVFLSSFSLISCAGSQIALETLSWGVNAGSAAVDLANSGGKKGGKSINIEKNVSTEKEAIEALGQPYDKVDMDEEGKSRVLAFKWGSGDSALILLAMVYEKDRDSLIFKKEKVVATTEYDQNKDPEKIKEYLKKIFPLFQTEATVSSSPSPPPASVSFSTSAPSTSGEIPIPMKSLLPR